MKDFGTCYALMWDAMERLAEKSWPVVFAYLDKINLLYDSKEFDQIAQDAVKNGHGDVFLDYTAAMLMVSKTEKIESEDDYNRFQTIAECLEVLASESWKSERYTDETNQNLRRKFADMANELNDKITDYLEPEE